MFSDGVVLTGLLFDESRDIAGWRDGGIEREVPVFRETRLWLDAYFDGRKTKARPPFRLYGSTPFRDEVLREVGKIPFGGTVTYGEIAAALAKRRGVSRISSQAVGGAVGWNPICLMIPCHRVIGCGGRLVGYGGGLANKKALLKHEGVETD